MDNAFATWKTKYGSLLMLCLMLLFACDVEEDRLVDGPEPAEFQDREAEASNDASAPDSLFVAYPSEVQSDLIADTSGAATWIDSTLADLTLDQKIGQLFIIDMPGLTSASDVSSSPQMQAVRQHGVGGFLISRVLQAEEVHMQATMLQEESAIPLFMAADYERGAGRFDSNFTELPSSMAIGATRDASFAASAGLLTALESRAVGVNLVFAPVVDVNNNPDNPIINIRSYGEDAQMVGQMGAEFVKEAEKIGLLTTLKHYPGHGDTSIDSHAEMGTVTSSEEQLERVELAPYKYILEDRGMRPAAIMTAHLWVQAIDDEPMPATFSRRALQQMLRNDMRYDGLIVTDDVKMGALQNDYSLTERTLRPLEAGADIILTPANLGQSVEVVRSAVREGRISEERIDESVRRVLASKARAGLHNDRVPPESLLASLLEEPRGEAVSEATAERAVTLLQTSERLPLREDQQALLIQLSNFRGAESIEAAKAEFEQRLTRQRDVDVQNLDDEPTAAQRQNAISSAEQADIVVMGLYLRLESGRGEAGLRPQQHALVQALLELDTPVILVTFGNPYVVKTYPIFDASVVAYDQTLASVRAVADVLQGVKKPTGRLPITVGDFPFGSGLGSLDGDTL